MTNINKINGRQKDVMAQYMVDHPNLAKNILPNCGQGKATAKRLWDELALKLNSYGPPTKDAKSWRKVFADQKFNAKKKISFNKASKQKTGGGPYQEMSLTFAEEQIIQATGVDLHVEGLSTVKTYGTPMASNTCDLNTLLNESISSILEDKDVDNAENECIEKERPRSFAKKEKGAKLSIMTSHVEKTEDYQRELLLKTDRLLTQLTLRTKKIEEYNHEQNLKLDRLLLIKERSLNIKEEEHRSNKAIKEVNLQIKILELEILKKQKNIISDVSN